MRLTISKQFQDFIEAMGLSLSEVLQKANIPNILWKEELELSPSDYYKFLWGLDDIITDDQILAFSDVKSINTFMPPFYVALCATNAKDGLTRFAKYKRLICPLIIEIDEYTCTFSIRMKFDIKDARLPRFTLLNEQLAVISLIRTGTGKDIKPLSIKGPYEYSEKVKEFIGIKPEKNDENLLVFQESDVLIPFVTQNNVMSDYLEPELKKRLAELSENNSFINLVKKTLFSAIPIGKFERADIAKALGVSVRTMQRKLENEGVTFQKEVQNVQKLLAISYVGKEELTTEEIAYMVGYKDPASFSRAFKSWTGKTVTEYKNEYKYLHC